MLVPRRTVILRHDGLLRRLVVRSVSTSSSRVCGPVGAAEERVAHRCARRDAERVDEDRGGRCRTNSRHAARWSRPGRDAKLVKNADEPAVAAGSLGSCPGNSHGEAGLAAVVMLLRLRRCSRSRAATGSGTSSQSAPSLSRMAPRRRRCRWCAARRSCWAAGRRAPQGSRRDGRRARGSDPAATAGSQRAGRQFPAAGLRPVSVDHRDGEVVDDALLAGPGQEGDDVPPGGRPGGEPLVEIVLGAVTEVPSFYVTLHIRSDRCEPDTAQPSCRSTVTPGVVPR